LTLAFADCELDRERRELRRAGKPVALEPRTFDLLLYLLENRDRAIGKDELQDAVWKTIVADTAITRAVMKLRSALGDRTGDAKIIKTVPRFGYHFIAGVGADVAAKESKQPKRHGIAVLPLANMSNDAENDYFGDGVAEEILNVLAKYPSLSVSSRTSSFAFRDSTKTLKEIADTLDVEIILEGSVRRSGNRVRITMQLIDAGRDDHLWSEVYDRELTDIFEVQAEIANEVAAKITVGSGSPIPVCGTTSNARACEYYMRGHQLYNAWDRGCQTRAQELYHRAIKLDPNFAKAWAALANSASMTYMWWHATDENLKLANSASERALELEPDLAEAHTARAFAMTLRRDYEAAEVLFEQALELDPQLWDAWYLYGRARFAQGKSEEAALLFLKAGEVRPDDYQSMSLASTAYAAAGDPDCARLYAKEAVRRAEAHVRLYPGDTRALTLGGCNLAEIGRYDEGVAWIEKAIELAPDDPGVLHNAGCFYAVAGDIDRAIDLFEKRFANSDVYMDWVDNDSDFDSVRDHPRFKAIVEAQCLGSE
jgi:adenylate cyclase